jgi:hypothetical protein
MGQYTNGFSQQRVVDALKGRLGWKQPNYSIFGTAPVLNSDNTQSASKRYFNDGSFHPLVTIDNYKATIEETTIEDDALNNKLEDLQSSIIMQFLSQVFNEPELIDNTELFERSLNNNQLINNAGKFVGIRFKLAPGTVAMQIKSIALYFNEAANFQLYLYHDTKKDPLWTDAVSVLANDQTIHIPTTELILNDAGQYKSGSFYLGYYQDQLGTAKAYWEQYRRNKSFAFDYQFFEAELSGDDFNRVSVPFTSINFGLNAEVATFHDHTQKILRNAALFDNLQGLQMAYHICKQLIFCVRSNANERILKDAYDKMGIQYELEGKVPISDVPKSTGLQDRINKELQRLKESFFPKPKAQSVSLVCSE